MTSLRALLVADDTRNRLELALRACGLPLSLAHDSYALAGSGAWHDAYWVRVPDGAQPLVVRLRKPVAYGEAQSYERHANQWRAEYVAANLYYKQANRAQPGISPTTYMYHVAPELVCTVEAYMGQQLDFAALDDGGAWRVGAQLGAFMRVMHDLPAPIAGWGELVWEGNKLRGAGSRKPVRSHLWQSARLRAEARPLLKSDVLFNRGAVQTQLNRARQLRRARAEEPIVLVNRDVSPENVTLRRDGTVGLIDPLPYLGNGTRHAAFFLHCYRFLLPALADTPRYAAGHYDAHSARLCALADGFEDAYTQGNPHLRRALAAEDWLWTIIAARECIDLLHTPELSVRQQQKHGTHMQISARLERCLRRLETTTL